MNAAMPLSGDEAPTKTWSTHPGEGNSPRHYSQAAEAGWKN